ncbi:MAG: hypothetical protein AB7L71_02065 [Vicinamibacterales bacterium]
MKAVLLVVDNPHREMRGMVGIWRRLWRGGVVAHIASKTTFNDWYAIMRPEVVVLPRATSEMGAFMESKASETRFVVVPSEHGAGFKNKTLNNVFGPNFVGTGTVTSAINRASLLLVGGENQRQWISEAVPALASRTRTTGTLSSDHWFRPKRDRGDRRQMGICTTFKSLLLASTTSSVHRLLYEHQSPDYDANAWRLKLQDYEFHYLVCLFKVIDQLAAAGYAVDIRPHPHEYWPGWRRWKQVAPSAVSLNRDMDLAHWLDGNLACITSFSTTGLDCIARGVPSISLEGMVKDQASRVPVQRQPLEGRFSWQASSVDELLSLLRTAERGELPPSPAMAEAGEFMRANFHWPRTRTAAALCVDEILRLLNEMPPGARTGRFRRLASVPRVVLKILAKDVRDSVGPRRSNLLFTFSAKIWHDAYLFNRDLDN